MYEMRQTYTRMHACKLIARGERSRENDSSQLTFVYQVEFRELNFANVEHDRWCDCALIAIDFGPPNRSFHAILIVK
jgi:hypothetical protein